MTERSSRFEKNLFRYVGPKDPREGHFVKQRARSALKIYTECVRRVVYLLGEIHRESI